MIGIAKFAWADSGSRILPGAFCDHLTSFGGVMTGTGQTVLSEFIRHGAAEACGTVTKPYNTPVKFPSPFLHIHYASGCTLAEAFYQSVHAPYQQLLIADPLCRPWARPPRVTVAGLREGDCLTRSRWIRPSAPTGAAAVRFELYVDGIRRDWCRPGGLLRLGIEGLAPGEHEARVVCLDGPLETTGRLIVRFSMAGAGSASLRSECTGLTQATTGNAGGQP